MLERKLVNHVTRFTRLSQCVLVVISFFHLEDEVVHHSGCPRCIIACYILYCMIFLSSREVFVLRLPLKHTTLIPRGSIVSLEAPIYRQPWRYTYSNSACMLVVRWHSAQNIPLFYLPKSFLFIAQFKWPPSLAPWLQFFKENAPGLYIWLGFSNALQVFISQQ